MFLCFTVEILIEAQGSLAYLYDCLPRIRSRGMHGCVRSLRPPNPEVDSVVRIGHRWVEPV